MWDSKTVEKLLPPENRSTISVDDIDETIEPAPVQRLITGTGLDTLTSKQNIRRWPLEVTCEMNVPAWTEALAHAGLLE